MPRLVAKCCLLFALALLACGGEAGDEGGQETGADYSTCAGTCNSPDSVCTEGICLPPCETNEECGDPPWECWKESPEKPGRCIANCQCLGDCPNDWRCEWDFPQVGICRADEPRMPSECE